MSKRLNKAVLATLNANVLQPEYDRAAIKNGIVHLGVGAFHRCHQAVYTEKVMNRFSGDWGICGVSLRNPKVRDALVDQDCLYTVSTNENATTSYQVIGAITEMLVAPENPTAVIEAIAQAECKVVTLTITEKGYCLNQATHELMLDDDLIQHDLTNLEAPQTAIGYLVASLQQRFNLGAGGITLLSCDNLTSNGKKLKNAVMTFAQHIKPELALWIEKNCSFPCSMVDRIVPATTPVDIDKVKQDLGIDDHAAVVTEPFMQWIIEDDFVAGRPEWEQVGAEIVNDVAPFEEMKLRLLNASHSTLAYLGCLAGYKTIAETIANQDFKALVSQLMSKEMQASLHGLDGFDLAKYQHQLIARFLNTGLKHETRQIAMDGSQKIPQRLLPAVQWQLEHDQCFQAMTLAIAAWVRYTQGIDENSTPYQVMDPMASIFQEIYQRTNGDNQEYLSEILALDDIFSPVLANNHHFSASVFYWLELLSTQGAKQTVHQYWGVQ